MAVSRKPAKPKRLFRNHEERRQPEKYDPNDIRYIAMHEAGHAVAAVVLGLPLHSTDIKRRPLPRGRVSVGYTHAPVKVPKGEAEALPHLIQTFAGPMAEAGINREADWSGTAFTEDREGARKIAAAAICEAEDIGGGKVMITPAEIKRNQPRIDKLLAEAASAAARFIEENDGAIIAVANALLERRSLTGDEVKAIVTANRMAD